MTYTFTRIGKKTRKLPTNIQEIDNLINNQEELLNKKNDSSLQREPSGFDSKIPLLDNVFEDISSLPFDQMGKLLKESIDTLGNIDVELCIDNKIRIESDMIKKYLPWNMVAGDHALENLYATLFSEKTRKEIVNSRMEYFHHITSIVEARERYALEFDQKQKFNEEHMKNAEDHMLVAMEKSMHQDIITKSAFFDYFDEIGKTEKQRNDLKVDYVSDMILERLFEKNFGSMNNTKLLENLRLRVLTPESYKKMKGNVRVLEKKIEEIEKNTELKQNDPFEETEGNKKGGKNKKKEDYTKTYNLDDGGNLEKLLHLYSTRKQHRQRVGNDDDDDDRLDSMDEEDRETLGYVPSFLDSVQNYFYTNYENLSSHGLPFQETNVELIDDPGRRFNAPRNKDSASLHALSQYGKMKDSITALKKIIKKINKVEPTDSGPDSPETPKPIPPVHGWWWEVTKLPTNTLKGIAGYFKGTTKFHTVLTAKERNEFYWNILSFSIDLLNYVFPLVARLYGFVGSWVFPTYNEIGTVHNLASKIDELKGLLAQIESFVDDSEITSMVELLKKDALRIESFLNENGNNDMDKNPESQLEKAFNQELSTKSPHEQHLLSSQLTSINNLIIKINKIRSENTNWAGIIETQEWRDMMEYNKNFISEKVVPILEEDIQYTTETLREIKIIIVQRKFAESMGLLQDIIATKRVIQEETLVSAIDIISKLMVSYEKQQNNILGAEYFNKIVPLFTTLLHDVSTKYPGGGTLNSGSTASLLLVSELLDKFTIEHKELNNKINDLIYYRDDKGNKRVKKENLDPLVAKETLITIAEELRKIPNTNDYIDRAVNIVDSEGEGIGEFANQLKINIINEANKNENEVFVLDDETISKIENDPSEKEKYQELKKANNITKANLESFKNQQEFRKTGILIEGIKTKRLTEQLANAQVSLFKLGEDYEKKVTAYKIVRTQVEELFERSFILSKEFFETTQILWKRYNNIVETTHKMVSVVGGVVTATRDFMVVNSHFYNQLGMEERMLYTESIWNTVLPNPFRNYIPSFPFNLFSGRAFDTSFDMWTNGFPPTALIARGVTDAVLLQEQTKAIWASDINLFSAVWKIAEVLIMGTETSFNSMRFILKYALSINTFSRVLLWDAFGFGDEIREYVKESRTKGWNVSRVGLAALGVIIAGYCGISLLFEKLFIGMEWLGGSLDRGVTKVIDFLKKKGWGKTAVLLEFLGGRTLFSPFRILAIVTGVILVINFSSSILPIFAVSLLLHTATRYLFIKPIERAIKILAPCIAIENARRSLYKANEKFKSQTDPSKPSLTDNNIFPPGQTFSRRFKREWESRHITRFDLRKNRKINPDVLPNINDKKMYALITEIENNIKSDTRFLAKKFSTIDTLIKFFAFSGINLVSYYSGYFLFGGFWSLQYVNNTTGPTMLDEKIKALFPRNGGLGMLPSYFGFPTPGVLEYRMKKGGQALAYELGYNSYSTAASAVSQNARLYSELEQSIMKAEIYLREEIIGRISDKNDNISDPYFKLRTPRSATTAGLDEPTILDKNALNGTSFGEQFSALVGDLWNNNAKKTESDYIKGSSLSDCMRKISEIPDLINKEDYDTMKLGTNKKNKNE